MRELRSTRWLLQGLSQRPSFGGFGLTLNAGSWAVEPHSTATRKYVHRDAIPKGTYHLDAKLNYNGEEAAAATATAIIE